MTSITPLRDLLDRLLRLLSADLRLGGLNPVQRAAIEYLARANRFSRQPSHVADYLAATRGTMSQTLKSLVQKGLVSEARAPEDGRVTRLSLTPAGRTTAEARRELDRVLAAIPDAERIALTAGLGRIVGSLVAGRGGRSFGLCATCRYHQIGPDGARCALLNLSLTQQEAGQICHEHAA